jgi:NAD(P)-dependent dehydrogenase (short-subunit alcohol dehydrogenase family)
VAELARRIGAPVDALINNAGVGFGADRRARETSHDGFELRFAVNYLAPFVLGQQLLAHGGPARAAINVASVGQAPIDLGDLQSTHGYDGVGAYCKSKLALIMLTLDWAAARPAVACNALHPGTYLDTGMVRESGIAPLGPASRGADAILGVLGLSLDDKLSGQYFDEQRPLRAHAQAYDAGVRRALHERTMEIVDPFLAPLLPPLHLHDTTPLKQNPATID